MIVIDTQKRLNARIDLACKSGLRMGANDERLAIVNIIKDKLCFDLKSGKGCEHQACYELRDLLNRIGKRI
jgi:hypothetical protein